MSLVIRATFFIVLTSSAAPLSARAEPTEPEDRYDLVATSETYLELFQRSLLPGPNGALLSTDTAVPLHEYVRVSARGIDSPWQADAVDFELSAWGRWHLTDFEVEPRLDADLQSAFVRIRQGPAWLSLGRQQVAGGAARFTRFDGARVGSRLGAGLSMEVYGGFLALARFDERPGYQHLGSAADSLLEDPEVTESISPSAHWLAGGRIGWASSSTHATVSFHEEREPEGLSRRNAGFDAKSSLTERIFGGTRVLFDLDAATLADMAVFVDTVPWQALDLSAEYRYAEPARLLSRQSVLSVFSTAKYQELGPSARFRATRTLSLNGSAFIQLGEDKPPSARGNLGLRWLVVPTRHTLLHLSYGRVSGSDNGYHSARIALASELLRRLSGTLEAYAYFYDEAISGFVTSNVFAGTLLFEAHPSVDVLLGSSIARSPYASLDAQALARLQIEFDASAGGPR